MELPQSLSAVHNVFHISQLKKCHRVPADAVDLESLDLQPGLTYEEHPIAILERDERRVKRSMVKFVKVQWSNGAIIPKMKPLGSVKINYVKNILNSFPMSKFSLYHPHFLNEVYFSGYCYMCTQSPSRTLYKYLITLHHPCFCASSLR